MGKKGFLPLIAVIMLFVTGCWSRVELNDLSIVTATAIDKVENGNIRLTLQIAVPTALGPAGNGGGSSGGEKKPTVVISESGETVMDAFRKLQEKIPRKLFFSHSRVIIIGEKMAKSGVSPILDFFSRYRESRLRSFIMFSKGEASDILKINPKWEKISAEELKEEEKRHTGVVIYFKDFLNMLLSDGIEPIGAMVKPKQTEVNQKKESQKDGSGSPSKEGMNVAITGTAVFHKDKLVGWMDDIETRGVLWLRDELKTSVITVDIPKEKGGGKISVQLLKAETKIKPVLEKKKVKMNIEVRSENELYENSSKLDLSDPKVIQFVQKKLDDETINRMKLTLNKAQKKFKSDIFGFGAAVYRTYPKEWKQYYKNRWDQEFPNVEATITAHGKVVRTGLTNKSVIWEEKEFIK